MTHLCLLLALFLGIGKYCLVFYSQPEQPQNHTEATAASCGRKIRLGVDTYLVSPSEQPQASHSPPRSQSPAQGLSSSPPSVELEGWFGSRQTEGHQMGLPVSCDCRKHRKEKKVSMWGLSIGLEITCFFVENLSLADSRKYLEPNVIFYDLCNVPWELCNIHIRVLHWLFIRCRMFVLRISAGLTSASVKLLFTYHHLIKDYLTILF